GNIGVIHRNRRENETAMKLLRRKLEIVRELDDQREIANTYGNMGVVYKNMKDYTKAMSCYQEQLHLGEKIQSKNEISVAIGNMGVIYTYRQEYKEALKCYRKQLVLKEKTGNKRGISIAVGNIGAMLQRLGKKDEAREAFTRQLELRQELGNSKEMIAPLINLAQMELADRHLDKALTYYLEILQIERRAEDPKLCYHLCVAAEILIQESSIDKATELLNEALKIAQKLGETHVYAEYLLQKTYYLNSNKEGKAEILLNMQALIGGITDNRLKHQLTEDINKLR
ncbi:MAG: tetratricopeptide repeat protein, partial [Candidatus Cloacimonetes bacterium]|nr:tetratricopeptide repeat protein [Candidatus Cloacimonadota bacterium]